MATGNRRSVNDLLGRVNDHLRRDRPISASRTAEFSKGKKSSFLNDGSRGIFDEDSNEDDSAVSLNF